MKFSQYKYERSSYEDIKDKFIKLVDKINKSTNYEDQKNYILQLNEIRNDIQSNSTIASIRYSIDTSDEYYEEEKKYWDEYMPLYEDFIAYGGWNHTCSDHKLTEQTETIMAYFPGAIRKDWIVDQKAHDEQVVIGYQCSCGDIHEVENN